jgi:flagellar basal body rod protein FlgB
MTNMTELLVKILGFIKSLQKVLICNISNMHDPDFVPRDLPVTEFSQLLDCAIDERSQNLRFVLCDTKNIKFGKGGNFEVRPMIDKYAKDLLDNHPDEYLALQINKLLENALNQKAAEALLDTINETKLAATESTRL